MRDDAACHPDAAPTWHMAVSDLARRWALARRAALRTVVPEAAPDLAEADLLDLAWTRDPQAALRRVYDNGRILGQGFCRTHRVDLTLVDLAATLPVLGAPCVATGLARISGATACESARGPCDGVGPAWCAYWREALNGLVNGLSSSVWYSRVERPEDGGRCVDLLHVEPWTPLRFRPIPDDLRPVVDRVADAWRRVAPGATVEFLGMADGALHVRVQDASSDRGPKLGQMLQQALQRLRPGLEVRDASPKPVLSVS